jgi:hypothetical protein
MRLAVDGMGIVAPGLADWPSTLAVLRGDIAYVPAEIGRLSPLMLPPNERRRATLPTRLALEAARQAIAGMGSAPTDLPSVFASADGNMALVDAMCRGICSEPPAISPTVFHNSVHNAVAGYWSIATGCMRTSTSVACWDGTVAAGLLEAATQLAADGGRLLFVAYDVPAPPPLDAHRHFSAPFAGALLLSQVVAGSGGTRLTLELTADSLEDRLPEALGAEIEALRAGNPAARLLTLLHALARGKPTVVHLGYLPGLGLRVEVEG